jgi:rubrerythrin
MNSKKAAPYSKLVAGIITAAEQQTMNFYMNMTSNYHNDLGRRLYSEIAMVEEMHVSQYESLKDPNCTWLENWLMHEYTECYLYFSMAEDETDPYIKEIWLEHFHMEAAHLKLVAELLKKYEKTNVTAVIPVPEFPPLLKFGQNKQYIRNVIARTVFMTSDRENYKDVRNMPRTADFFRYNQTVNARPADVPSHAVINKSIETFSKDYRYQESPHPIKELDDRTKDNTSVGRE